MWLAAWAVSSVAWCIEPDATLAQFFSNNAFGDAKLSPSGRYLAARTSPKGRRDILAVIDLDTNTGKTVAEFSDADVGAFQWVNESRLVYNLHDTRAASGDQVDAPGLYAVNRDGGELKQLVNRNGARILAQPWNTFMMDQPGDQLSEWIYVTRPLYDHYDDYFGTRLRRLNTTTAMAEVAPEPDVEVSDYMLDFQGQPRLAISYNVVLTQVFYRDPGTGKWRKVASFAPYGSNAFTPLGFGPDGTLYVIANAGANLATLRTFDLVAGTVSKEALVPSAGYDFDGTLITDNEKVLGVRVRTDAESNIWFDPAMQALQVAVDKAFPTTVNLLSVPADHNSARVLVESYSDRQPPRFAVYHKKTGDIDMIGSTYPAIQAAHMGRQETVHVKARDGLDIPGLLTLPATSGRSNLPMVVLVHGGPWVRGASWGWRPEPQFLASRGYAVLELEFRGSTGFGMNHFVAGMKQWGLAMQNDIADGTRWAIAQGIADPARICIAGASYGGYAALMGLVNDPDLFRCGIEWIGVTDIELMYKGTWFSKSDASPAALRYSMPAMIGDLKQDAAQLKATSPIQQAARIRQPLLLAYGSEDKRVPIYHGKKFLDAVTRTNKQVEFVEYKGEAHGWSLPKTRIDFWGRVENFLDRHIGTATAPAVPNASP